MRVLINELTARRTLHDASRSPRQHTTAASIMLGKPSFMQCV